LEKHGMHALMFAQEYLRPQTDVCCNVAGLVIASHQFHPDHASSNVCMALRTQQTRTNKSTSFLHGRGNSATNKFTSYFTVVFTNINLKNNYAMLKCLYVSLLGRIKLTINIPKTIASTGTSYDMTIKTCQ
jgi:hypothetical protein